MMTVKKIYFDMDGTIANLYGVEGWLDDLNAYNPRPYAMAKPMVNMQALAHRLNNLQRAGYEVCVISWLSKTSTKEYDELVTRAKLVWDSSRQETSTPTLFFGLIQPTRNTFPSLIPRDLCVLDPMILKLSSIRR